LLELHGQLEKCGVFHMDICPRHLMCHPDGGLLVIDWGFAVIGEDAVSKRLSGRCAVSLLCLVASAHTHLPFQSFPSGKSPYAAPKGTKPSDGQLHTIVKTVYALTHAGFVERILRFVALDSESVASAWKTEWASDNCGKMWRDLASGTKIEMLAFSARGCVIP
jgi:hypothetical protein